MHQVLLLKNLKQGLILKKIKDLYIVYISENDFVGAGFTTYHIDKVIRENGITVDDGLHEIFVNE